MGLRWATLPHALICAAQCATSGILYEGVDDLYFQIKWMFLKQILCNRLNLTLRLNWPRVKAKGSHSAAARSWFSISLGICLYLRCWAELLPAYRGRLQRPQLTRALLQHEFFNTLPLQPLLAASLCSPFSHICFIFLIKLLVKQGYAFTFQLPFWTAAGWMFYERKILFLIQSCLLLFTIQ